MTTTAVTRQNLSSWQSSKTTTAPTGVATTGTSRVYGMIPVDYAISVDGLDVIAVVIQNFFVSVQPGIEEYTVTSNISNSYEFGKTVGQAIKNYLEILVEELVWLEKNKTDLSPSILEDLYRLKIYIRIV